VNIPKPVASYNFKYVGHIDVTKFRDKLSVLSDDDWNEYSFRQKQFSVHQHTQTVPLLYDESFSDYPQAWRHYEVFESEVRDLDQFLLNFYKTGKITRCVLAKLLRGAVVYPHIDYGDSLMTSNRHHLPLVTNNKVLFTVGDDTKHLPSGEVWEINNAHMHGVQNEGDEDRVHVIVDWKVELQR
jgi:hypothetical protein